MVPVIQAGGIATISLNPVQYTAPEPGQAFTINVNITYVPPLKYYAFKLSFDNTVLNATDVIPGPVNPSGTVYGPVENSTWTPLQNVSEGFIWVTANLSQTFWNTNGTLMTINFKALKLGSEDLHLYDTILINPQGTSIIHNNGPDCYIDVLPEFPTIMVVPLLLIATLIAVSLGKFWSRKRKCPRQTRITIKESYC
jgi:hypothetical protein